MRSFLSSFFVGYFYSDCLQLLKLSLKHLDHRLDSSDDVTWICLFNHRILLDWSCSGVELGFLPFTVSLSSFLLLCNVADLSL